MKNIKDNPTMQTTPRSPMTQKIQNLTTKYIKDNFYKN